MTMFAVLSQPSQIPDSLSSTDVILPTAWLVPVICGTGVLAVLVVIFYLFSFRSKKQQSKTSLGRFYVVIAAIVIFCLLVLFLVPTRYNLITGGEAGVEEYTFYNLFGWKITETN